MYIWNQMNVQLNNVHNDLFTYRLNQYTAHEQIFNFTYWLVLVPSFVLNFERISFFINFREYSFKWLMWIRGIVYNARVHTKDVNLCKLYFVRESCQQHTYGGHNRGGCYRVRYSIGIYKKDFRGQSTYLNGFFPACQDTALYFWSIHVRCVCHLLHPAFS